MASISSQWANLDLQVIPAKTLDIRRHKQILLISDPQNVVEQLGSEMPCNIEEEDRMTAPTHSLQNSTKQQLAQPLMPS